VANTTLVVRIPLDLRKQLWTQLAMENNMTKDIWNGRPMTFSDLVRELLKRGLAERLRELSAKTDVASTLTAKPSGQ
jgi:hypothetical protein